MFIKKNDKVFILAGKDRGKTGKVLQVFPKLRRVSVEGVNITYKHLKKRGENQKGQRIEFPASFESSNCKLVCPKCEKPTRVGYKLLENGKKERQCHECQATFA